MTQEELSERQQELKEEFIEEVGFWPDAYDEWLRLNPDSFEVYGRFAAHPWQKGELSRKEKALVLVALDGCATHLYTEGLRFHVKNALDAGASVEEIMEALELVSVAGLHSMIEGMPLVQEHCGLPEDVDESVREEQEAVKEKFKEGRGYWSDFWEAVLRMDHEFLDKYTDLSSHPWAEGVLDPKMKEFIYIAADVSTTHLYTQGLESHIENAIEYGATRDELLELIELVSEQGYDTMIEGLPIIVEEAQKRGEL